MIKVRFNNEVRYKGVLKNAHEDFNIDDNDKDEMVKLGAIIIDGKVSNPNKVTKETKAEPKVEAKEEPKFEPKFETFGEKESKGNKK